MKRPTVLRYRSTLAAAIAIVTLASANGCRHAVAAPPVIAPPPPTVLPVAPPPVVISNWSVSPTLAPTRYVSEVSAILERDSAGRVLQEHVNTRALISLQGRRDSLGGMRVSGVVDSFTVSGLERALAPSNQTDNANSKSVVVVPALPLVVPFDAVLDARNIRVTTRPPLANECDRPESGATSLVRELLVRIPKTLTVGARWRDSTIGFFCRLSVPITSRARSEYTVERSEKVQDRTELILRRVTDTQLDGNLKSAWRTATLSGNGRATQTIRIDATTGVVRNIDGDGLLTIKLTDTARRDGSGTQELRQKTTSRTVARL